MRPIIGSMPRTFI